MQLPASNDGCKYFKHVRSYSDVCLALIAMALCSVIPTQAQEPTLTSRTGQPGITIEEVIVTGSNIPTAEEVGPQPVDTYRKVDIERLGVRSATDFVQKLPVATGPSINENLNTIGGGQTEIDLRGLASKETLVLQDARRLAPNGLASYDVALNSFFGWYTRPQRISPWAH
jgi:outer membrane receptor protein involved in Fe transport